MVEAAGAVLEVAKVTKYFGDYAALREVSFALRGGECLALLGRNGAGKTTLLKILAGLSGAASGTVQLFGAGPRQPAARRRIGVLGHGIGVYDELTARENLAIFAKLYGMGPACVDAWLEKTSLARVADSPVREFSRGMRQRLAVARAFLHEPALFILDEPFTALDDRAIALLQGLLAAAKAEGRTIIMSTHQLREAMELATHVALIERGRLVHFGPREAAMLADPSYVYRTFGSL